MCPIYQQGKMCPIYQQGKWEAVELVLDQGEKTLSGWIMGFHQAGFSLFSNFSLVVRIVYSYNRLYLYIGKAKKFLLTLYLLNVNFGFLNSRVDYIVRGIKLGVKVKYKFYLWKT